MYRFILFSLCILLFSYCDSIFHKDYSLKGNWYAYSDDRIYYEISFSDSILHIFHSQIGIIFPNKYEFIKDKKLLIYADEEVKISKMTSKEFTYNWKNIKLHFKRMPPEYKFTFLDICRDKEMNCYNLLEQSIFFRQKMVENEDYAEFKKAAEGLRGMFIEPPVDIYRQIDSIYDPIVKRKYGK